MADWGRINQPPVLVLSKHSRAYGLFGGQMNPKCDLDRAIEKDKDRRELPLVDKVAQLLVDIQTGLPEGQEAGS